MNDEFEKVWKKAVMAYFEVVSWHSSGGTDDNYQDNHYPSQDLDHAPLKYKSETLLPEETLTRVKHLHSFSCENGCRQVESVACEN
jgi:hypothetical protein